MSLREQSSNTRRAVRQSDSGCFHSIAGAPPAPTRSERDSLPLARAQVRIYAADGGSRRRGVPGGGAGSAHLRPRGDLRPRPARRYAGTAARPDSPGLPLPGAGPAPGRAVARWRPQDDIAVLELESAPPAGVEPAPLAAGGDLWGHSFRACGFPAGHPEGVWAGGVGRGPTARSWLQIEDTKESGYRVQPGFSGAPVWDDVLGGVVGMVSAAERDPGVKAAFIIPAALLPPPPSGPGGRLGRAGQGTGDSGSIRCLPVLRKNACSC